MDRILIVNADDFGYTHGVNAAIDRCARQGIVRSATLMANGSAFDDAVSKAKENGELRIGVHLVLTELNPLSDARDIPGLVDDRGRLPSTPGKLLASICRKEISSRAIRHELNMQLAKILDNGLQVTHLDSHKHVHLLPQVLEPVCELASKYSIKWIRNPFDETRCLKLLPKLESGKRRVFLKQHVEARLMSGFRQSFFARIRSFGLAAPDHFYGVSLTGVWNEAAAMSLVGQLGPGLSEWMFHPGDCDLELRRNATRLLEQREKERDLLISPSLIRVLDEKNILLRSHGGNGR